MKLAKLIRALPQIAFLFAALSCATQQTAATSPAADAEANRVILGDEQPERYLPFLKGKRVALFSNQSGIVGDKIILQDGLIQHGGFTKENVADRSVDAASIPFGLDEQGNPVRYGEHILDALIAQGVDVKAVFCPEHGFRGTEDAGANIESSVDEKTGIPILSLYQAGADTPSEEALSTFDTLVVDLQDVGLRYYTYYITLYRLMDACAKNGKSVVILDRPNPNGFYVDGEILQDAFRSNVGALPIPTVHGMTLGELARMINGEGWLSAGKNACNLTVIPCKHYAHGTKYALIRAPSPNLKDMRAVYLYASICFFENTIVSVGRGTQFPFETYGSPYFEGVGKNTFQFTPQSIPGAQNPPFKGTVCYGTDLRTKPIEDIWKEGINLSYIVAAYKDAQSYFSAGTADKFFGEGTRKWIDLLSGSSALRTGIIAGKSAAALKAGWQGGIERFKIQRKPYLLYREGNLLSNWQVDASFPDWISNANFSANNALSFRFFRGQGTVRLSVSEACTSFSFYINDHRVNTKKLAPGGIYDVDISAFTKDGLNTLQVSDIQPSDVRNAVRVQIPYPVVKDASLASSGISASAIKLIDSIISTDIDKGFTSAQLAVVKDGRLVYQNAWGTIQTYDSDGARVSSAAVTNDTLYDLASVTKMLSINFAVQYLATQGRLSPETKIVDILGDEFASETIDLSYPNPRRKHIPLDRQIALKRTITVRDLLCHTAGMHPGPNYYSDRFNIETGSFDSDAGNKLYTGADGSEATRRETLRQLFRTPLLYEPGTDLLYSDLDYMILCFVVEQITGQRLDVFLSETFWKPMGLTHITYNPLEHGFSKTDCAATDPYGNTNSGKISFTGVRTGVIQGEVHDAKAYCCMGGVSGHAGLFANAADAARLLSVMLTGGWGKECFFSPNVLDTFTAPQSLPFADYGFGWWRSGEQQTPRHFGTVSSSAAFGHQGFTGTLAFVDPSQNLVIVYLTNKINTPMVIGQELMNQFTGNFYQSSVTGFVPQIILMGLNGSPKKAQWKSFVHDMAEDARRKAEREAGNDKRDVRWKAYAALEEVYREWK